ncbi:hypothetical protein [Hyunsoonleella rubra]|uniref:Uncharacterized protein n=1 Tax=Hyunsoonleella rubra TaxID=1737062 RepID=A0ABW5T6C6_9FLAO
MPKLTKFLLLIITSTLIWNCSSDDNNCPDVIIVDINDPESIKRAEDCGLAPAEPVGTIWVSENHRIKYNLRNLKVD